MADLEQIAASLVGVPFAHHGRDPKTGLDCFGLFLLVMRAMGNEIPDYAYEQDWAKNGGNLFIENYWKHAKEVAEREAQPGDAILFRHVPGIANHVAILLQHGRFLHCSRAGVVIERLSDSAHRRRIEGFYRIIA